MKEHTHEYYKFTPRTMKIAFMTVIVVPGTLFYCFKDWFVISFSFSKTTRIIDLSPWEQEEEKVLMLQNLNKLFKNL